MADTESRPTAQRNEAPDDAMRDPDGLGAMEAPVSGNLLQRFIDVHVSPTRAFRAVAADPGTWWQPLILLVLVTAGVLELTWDRLGVAMIVEQLAERGSSEEDITRAVELASAFRWLGLLDPLFRVFVSALALHAAYGLVLGGSGRFVQSLAVTAYAMLLTVLQSVVHVPIMLARETHAVYLGPAVLVPGSMQDGMLFRFMTQLDVFAIWKVLLIGLGMGIAHRLPAGKATGAVVILWLGWAFLSTVLGS